VWIRALILLALCVAPDRPRLLVIGDSLTAGLAASSERATFKQLLAQSLDADLGSQRVTRLEDAEQASLVWQPDIIVLEIGLNDVISPTLEEEEWRARYGALLDRLQATGATVVAATPFRGVYGAHPKWGALERYAGYVREAAADRGARVADLWGIACVPGCLSQPGEPSPFSPLFEGDNFHPNNAGHALIAQILLRALRPYTVWVAMVR
jgi:lysophospholipase L1-like esterase